MAVEMADGTYIGNGNYNIVFGGKVISLRSQSDNPEDCIIDVQGSAGIPKRGVFFQHGETLESHLRGITIKNAIAGDIGGYG